MLQRIAVALLASVCSGFSFASISRSFHLVKHLGKVVTA